MCEVWAAKNAKGTKGTRKRENSGREAGIVSEERTVNGAGEGGRGMLTGKERCLRGVRYFAGVFAAEFVPVFLSWLWTAGPHERHVLGESLGVWSVLCLPAAVLMGLVSMLFRRRRRWHRVAAEIVAVAAIVTWGWLIGRTEAYCPWNPAIDTEFTAGYSEKAFFSIQPGMTEAEVVALLGEPFDKHTWDSWQGDEIPCDCWVYSGDGKCGWGDFAHLGRMVMLRDGVVLALYAQVYYD